MQPDAALRSPVPSEGASPGSDFAAHAVGNGPRAVPVARTFVRHTLRSWALDGLSHDVCVAVTELAANALRHGCRTVTDHAAPRPVWLGLLRQGRDVLCVVADPGQGVPCPREPDFLAESGRGLHVVAALSDSWGWTRPDRDGKAVWALFSERSAVQSPTPPRLGWPLAAVPAC